MKAGVHEDMSFLEAFLRNLLMGEHNELKNRYMHIRWDKTAHSDEKQYIEQHIEDENSILKVLDTKDISSKTKNNIIRLFSWSYEIVSSACTLKNDLYDDFDEYFRRNPL